MPAIHIHLASPAQESAPVTARPWYFTGGGFLWLLVALAILGGAGWLAWHWLLAQGWL